MAVDPAPVLPLATPIGLTPPVLPPLQPPVPASSPPALRPLAPPSAPPPVAPTTPPRVRLPPTHPISPVLPVTPPRSATPRPVAPAPLLSPMSPAPADLPPALMSLLSPVRPPAVLSVPPLIPPATPVGGGDGPPLRLSPASIPMFNQDAKDALTIGLQTPTFNTTRALILQSPQLTRAANISPGHAAAMRRHLISLGEGPFTPASLEARIRQVAAANVQARRWQSIGTIESFLRAVEGAVHRVQPALLKGLKQRPSYGELRTLLDTHTETPLPPLVRKPPAPAAGCGPLARLARRILVAAARNGSVCRVGDLRMADSSLIRLDEAQQLAYWRLPKHSTKTKQVVDLTIPSEMVATLVGGPRFPFRQALQGLGQRKALRRWAVQAGADAHHKKASSRQHYTYNVYPEAKRPRGTRLVPTSHCHTRQEDQH